MIYYTKVIIIDARFEVFLTVKRGVVFSGLLLHTMWTCNPEDGGSTVLQNIGIHPPHHTAQSRKPLLLWQWWCKSILCI